MRLGTIDDDFHVRAVDLARLLKISEFEIGRLARTGVLRRLPDPKKSKLFTYPVFENVTRFIEARASGKEAIHREFLKAKAGRERATQLKVEMLNRERAGELVDKTKLISELTPIVASYRQTMLTRADRLERQLSVLKGRKRKVAAIRAADLDALSVLADLFRNGKAKRA
jgi:hypothetical protein